MIDLFRKLAEAQAPEGMRRDQEVKATLDFMEGRGESKASRVLGWHGITGRGKSYLRALIEHQLHARVPDGLSFASVSCREGTELDQLLSLRVQLARRSRMKFLLFDWAFIRYFQLTHPHADIRQHHANLFTRSGSGDKSREDNQASDEIIDWLMDAGKGLVGTSVEVGLSMVPSWGLIQKSFSSGAGWIRKRLEEGQIREQINLIDSMSASDLATCLAHFMAHDLNRERARGVAPDRVAILIDDAEVARIETVPKLPPHSWPRALIENSRQVEFVLFTEDRFGARSLEGGFDVTWMKLHQEPLEIMAQYLEQFTDRKVADIVARASDGEPLFAAIAVDYCTKTTHASMLDLSHLRREYFDRVVGWKGKQHRLGVMVLAAGDPLSTEDFMVLAPAIVGPDVNEEEYKIYSRIAGNCSLVEIALPNMLREAALEALWREQQPLADRMRQMLIRKLDGRFQSFLSTEERLTWRAIVTLTDFFDFSQVEAIDGLHERALRHENRPIVKEIVRAIRKNISTIRPLRLEDASPVEAMLLKWEWAAEMARGRFDTALQLAREHFQIAKEGSTIAAETKLGTPYDPILMCLEAEVQISAYNPAFLARRRSITIALQAFEAWFWRALNSALGGLMLDPSQVDEGRRAVIRRIEPHLGEVRTIVESRQLSKLPDVVDHLKKIEIQADGAASALRGGFWPALEGSINCTNALKEIEAFEEAAFIAARRVAFLEESRSICLGYLKLCGKVRNSLGLEQRDYAERVIQAVQSCSGLHTVVAHARILRSEFSYLASQAQNVDQRRLWWMAAVIVQGFKWEKDEAGLIAFVRDADRVLGWAIQHQDDVEFVRIYVPYAEALWKSGERDSAKTVVRLMWPVALRARKSMAQDDVRSGVFHGNCQVLSKLASLEA